MTSSTPRAFFSGFVLVCPLPTFAGSQSVQMRVPTKAEMQDRTGVTQAMLQGKGGGGVTRNQTVLRGNAYRSQTPQDAGTPQHTRSRGTQFQRPGLSQVSARLLAI
jgi:hypothetical protein